MKILKEKSKLAQEEIVGFVVIIVIVAVVLLVLLGFLLRSPESGAVNNYEIESFIQATFQYTSSCESQVEFLSIQSLIVSCERGEKCLSGLDSCDVLNESLKGLIGSAWNVKNGSAVKGYKFSVAVEDKEKIVLKEGEETSSYVGGWQDFSKKGSDYVVSLNVYS